MRHHGVTFGYHARNGYFGSAHARDEIDRIAAIGFDWLCPVILAGKPASQYLRRWFRRARAACA